VNQKLLKFRYYLEFISLPAFIYLVIHLTSHGVELIRSDPKTEEHSHPHHHYHYHAYEFNPDNHKSFLQKLITVEILIGIALLILFVWIWHRSALKKLVPCTHEHCHSEAQIPHILALTALCLHFFPEAIIRSALLDTTIRVGSIDFWVAAGFGAHFVVDVIVALIISLYWKNSWQFIASLLVISAVWVIAFIAAEQVKAIVLTPYTGGVLFVAGGFILSMFIHKPHKPVLSCDNC